MVVDSANGIGAVLDPQEFVYMNTDTTVQIGPDGAGVTTAQALLVQRS